MFIVFCQKIKNRTIVRWFIYISFNYLVSWRFDHMVMIMMMTMKTTTITMLHSTHAYVHNNIQLKCYCSQWTIKVFDEMRWPHLNFNMWEQLQQIFWNTFASNDVRTKEKTWKQQNKQNTVRVSEWVNNKTRSNVSQFCGIVIAYLIDWQKQKE